MSAKLVLAEAILEKIVTSRQKKILRDAQELNLSIFKASELTPEGFNGI